MAGESLHTTAQDEVIKQQRVQLYPEIRTFTAAVLNNDSILQVALGELQLNQRDVLFDCIADYAGVVKFGRTQKEQIHRKKDKDGFSQFVDPVKNRYVAKLRRAKVSDIDGHLGVVEKTSRVVLNSFQQEFGFIKTQ